MANYSPTKNDVTSEISKSRKVIQIHEQELSKPKIKGQSKIVEEIAVEKTKIYLWQKGYWVLREQQLRGPADLYAYKISNYKKTLTAPELTSNGKLIFGLQIEIERLLSQYMKLANSTTGGYGVSRSGDPIEAKVERISKMMSQLEDKPALNKIKRKWAYIEKTILKYNEDIAPYIVIHVVNDLRKLTQQQLK